MDKHYLSKEENYFSNMKKSEIDNLLKKLTTTDLGNNTEIKYMNTTINKKNSKISKTSKKLKNCIENIRQNTQNFDVLYEKSRIFYGRTLNKLLPLTQEENEELAEEMNKVTERRTTDYNSQILNLLSVQDDVINGNRRKLLASPRKILSQTSSKFFSVKQYNQVLSKMHPRFVEHIKFIYRQIKFTKENQEKLKTPKLLRDIKEICVKAINEDEITVEGVTLRNLNNFDVNREYDPNFLKILHSNGPLKAFSRYSNDSKICWQPCLVVFIDDKDFFHIIWDWNNYEIIQGIFTKTWSVDLEYCQNYYVEIGKHFKIKKVYRINLYFENENHEKHLKRYEDAICAKIIYDYQNIYFKKISDRCSATAFVEKFNDLSLKLVRINKKLKPRLLNKKEESIIREIFAFHKMAICKVDIEMIENKINMLYNFKPWANIYAKQNFNTTRSQIKLLFNLYNFFCENENLPVFTNNTCKTNFKSSNLLFLTTSTNIDTYVQSETSQNLESLGNKFFNFVRDYSQRSENVDSKWKISRFNSYLQEYRAKKLKDQLINFFNIFSKIKYQFNTEEIISFSDITSIKNEKGFTDAYKTQKISSVVTFDNIVVSCLKEFRNINKVFICDFLFTNEIVLREDKFPQQDGLQIKMFNNQSKLASLKDKIKLLIDISMNRIDSYKEKVSSDMFEKFKFEEDTVIFLREKEILNKIINYQKIYKLINKQFNNSIQIALGKSLEKIENFFANLILAIPVDENLEKFFKITISKEFYPKEEEFKTFNIDVISLKDYFNNSSKIKENRVDLETVKILMKTITAYYKQFHYTHIKQDSFYSSISDNLKLMKIKLKINNRKKGPDHLHEFLNLYETLFNQSSSLHLDISIKNSLSNSNDSKVYNNSYFNEMGNERDFLTNFKIFEIYDGINLKFLNELKNSHEKRSSNIFHHFQQQNRFIKEPSDDNFSEWQVENIIELINFYDLELSETDSSLNEVFQYFEDYFMERFRDIRITKPVFSYNVIKKLGIKEEEYEICSKTKMKINKGGLYSIDKNPNINNLSYDDYIKYYESAIKGSKVIKDTEALKKRIRDSITTPLLQLKNNSYYGIFSYVLIIIFYYPFYKFNKESFKKFFTDRNHNQNILEFCDFMIDTLTTVESDLLLLPDEVKCGVIVLKITKVKLLIKNNIQNAKNVIFSICHSKIKEQLINGEKEFLSVRQYLSKSINNIDDYIDQTEYIKSDNFANQLYSVESVYANCQKNYSLFEKNFKTIDAKLFILMFESYEWSFILKNERNYLQRRLNEDLRERVEELTKESDYLINETDSLERDMKKLNEMTKFDFCIENEEFVEKLHYQSTVIENRVTILNRRQEDLNFPKTNLTQLNFFCETINLFKLSWGFISKWNFRYDKWLKEPIYTNNREEIKEVIENGWELCSNLNIFVKENNNNTIELISSHIYNQLGGLFKLSPIYYNMRDYIIKEWHWKDLIEHMFSPLIANGVITELPNYKTVTLNQIIDYKIPNPKDFINREIKEKAVEEHNIETNLHKVDEHLRSLDFIIVYWNQYGIYLIKNGQEVLSLLKENSIELEYVVKNKRNYIKPYFDKIVEMRLSITNVKKTLKLFLLYQKTMILLVKVFHNKEVSKELQVDFKNFTRLFYDYKDITYKIYTSRNILSFLDHKSNIETMITDVSSLHMKLKEYITKYKYKNPRFIFLSEDSLLSFLSNYKNKNIFAKYISQIFPGVKNLKFKNSEDEMDDVNEKNIAGIETYYHEILAFSKYTESLDDVVSLADWIRSFESSIINSLKINFKLSLFRRINPDEDIRVHLHEEHSICSQYSVLIENILIFSRLKAIFDYEYNDNKNSSEIFEYVVLSKLKSLKYSITFNLNLIQNNLSSSTNSIRFKAENLIINLIQMREYLDYLITKQAISYNSFEIYSQIKPAFLLDFKKFGTKRIDDYFAVDDEELYSNQKNYCSKFINTDNHSEFLQDSEIFLSLSVLNLSYKYGYELSSEQNNLILNPTTDKTLLNLCSSLAYNFFTMIVGNKLAGKTQTVKGFLQLLAKPYVEWNCNAGENSYQCMSNILKQTASSGYSLIIEDVNCIQRDVMSSLTQNIYNIRAALIDRNGSAYIDNTYVSIDPSFFLYSTYCIYDGTFSQAKQFANLNDNTCLLFEMMPKNIVENFRFIYLIAPDYEYIIQVYICALMGILYSVKTTEVKVKSTSISFNLETDNPSDNSALFSHSDEIKKKFILFLKMLDRTFKDSKTDDTNSQKTIMEFLFFTITNIKSIFSLVKKFLYDFNDGITISNNLACSKLNIETFSIKNINDKNLLFQKLLILAVFEKCRNFMTDINFQNFRTISISVFGFECSDNLKPIDFDPSFEFKEKIQNYMLKANLIETNKFINYLSMAINIISNSQSILILGDPITSKSTIIKVLINLYFQERNEFLSENFVMPSNLMLNRQNKLHLEHELYAYHLNLNTIDFDKIFGKYYINNNQREWTEGIIQSIIKSNNESDCTPNEENFENSAQFLCSSYLKKIIEKDLINISINNTKPCRNASDESVVDDLMQLDSENEKDKEINIIKCKHAEKWILFDYTNQDPTCSRNDIASYINNPLERLTSLIENKFLVNLSLENQDFPKLNLIQSNLKFVFETNSIKHASPSFVSKSNIVFIQNDTLQSITLFKTYLDKDLLNIFEDYREHILKMYEQIVLPFFESSEIQSFYRLNISDKLMTLNFIKSLKINFYELTKQLIFTDKISYGEVNRNQLTRDVNRNFEGYINLNEENSQEKTNNKLAKKETKVVGSRNILQMRRKTAKSFIRFSDNTSNIMENIEPLNEEIEAIFMSCFTINVGSILKREYKGKAEKFFKCLLDKFINVSDSNKRGINKKMSVEGSEKFQSRNSVKNIAFGFNIIQSIPNFPSDLFDFYFELRDSCWLRTIDYPFHDYTRYEFHGKFSESDVSKSQTRSKESSRFVSNSYKPKSLLKFQNANNFTSSTDPNCVYIPTSNYVKISQILNLAISYTMPLLIFGPASSGKTTMIKSKLLYETEKNSSRFIHINTKFRENIGNLQCKIQSNLEKKQYGHYMSPGNKLTYIFLDDVNLCKYDARNDTRNPLELNREWSQFGGWYDTKQPNFNKIDSISFISTYTYNKDNFNPTESGLTERELRYFYFVFLDEFERDDYVNIMKAHFTSFLKHPVNDDNLINLILVESFAEKIWILQKYKERKRDSQFINFSMKNLCTMMHCFRLFKIDSSTTIENLLDIWMYSFRSLLLDGYNFNDVDNFVKNMVTDLVKNNQDLAKILVENKNINKFPKNIDEIQEENSTPNSSGISDQDSSLEMIENRQVTHFNDNESCYDDSLGDINKISLSSTKLEKIHNKSVREISSKYGGIYTSNINNLISQFHFLKDYENKISVLKKSDRKNFISEEKRGSQTKFNYFRSYSVIPSIDKDKKNNFENLELKPSNRPSLDRQISNSSRRISFNELTEIKEEEYVVKSNQKIFMEFTRDKLDKIIEIIDTRSNINNVVNSKYKKEKAIQKMDIGSEHQKEIVLLILIFLKSISFVVSKDELEETANKFFETSLYIPKVNEILPKSEEDNIEKNTINSNDLKYATEHETYQIVKQKDYTSLLEFYNCKFNEFNLAKQDQFNKNSLTCIYRDKSETLIQRFFINILQMNFMLESLNNFYIIKSPNYIDQNLISFILNNLSNILNYEAFIYRIQDSFDKEFKSFKTDIKKIVNDIIFSDKKFMIVQEVESYCLTDRLCHIDVVDQIKEIFNFLEILNLRMLDENFQNLRNLKKLEDLLQMNISQPQLKTKNSLNNNFDYFCVKMLDKISLNLKIILVIRENMTYNNHELFKCNTNKHLHIETLIASDYKNLLANATIYHFDYKLNKEEFFLANLKDIQPHQSIFEETYLYARELITKKKYKLSKKEDIKYPFEEANSIFLIMNNKFRDLFKSFYLKNFKRNLKLLKYFEDLRNYAISLKIKNESTEKQCLEKKENISILIEKASINKQYLDELERLIDKHSKYNLAENYQNLKIFGELFMNSLSGDDNEDFKSDLNKKIFSKNCLKIVFFFEHFYKNLSNNRILKNNLSADEKASFTKEYSNFQNLKENFKKIENLQILDKFSLLQDISSECAIPPGKVPNIYKTFNNYLYYLQTYLSNLKWLLDENLIKYDYKKLIATKDGEDILIKQYKDDNEQNLFIKSVKMAELKNLEENLQNSESQLKLISTKLEKYRNILTSLDKIINSSSVISFKFIQDQIQESESANQNIEKLSLFFSIYFTLISSLEFSIQIKAKTFVLQKLFYSTKLEPTYLYKTLPSKFHKYIHKAVFYGENLNETFLDSLLSLQILLRLNTKPVYIVDQMGEVESFLLNSRKKHCCIESNTTNERTIIVLRNCMRNGDYLIIKNIDSKLYDLIKPILVHFNRKFFNLGNDRKTCENEPQEELDLDNIHPSFRLIIIDSVESRLYKSYLGNHTIYMKFAQLKKNLIKESAMCKIFSHLEDKNYSKVKVNSGLYFYGESIHKSILNKLVNALEYYSIFSEIKNFEFNKQAIKDWKNLDEILKIIQIQKFIFNRKVEKIKNKFPTAKNIINKDIDLTDIYNEVKVNSIERLFKLIKEKINSNNSSIDLLVNYNKSIRIINKLLKEFYNFSEKSFYNNLDISIHSFLSMNTADDNLSFDESVRNCLKFISARMYTFYYYSMKEDHFQLFGFLVSISTYKDSCQNEEEYLALKKLFSKIFRNKATNIKNNNENESLWEDLAGVGNILPEVLNNFRIDLILETFSNKSDAEVIASPLKTLIKQTSNMDKRIEKPAKFKTSEKEKVFKILEKSETSTENINLRLSKRHTLKTTLKFENIKEMLSNDKQKEEANKNIEIESLNTFPYSNYCILKSVMRLIPDFMKVFSKILNHEDQSLITFMKNQNIEDIINNVEVELDFPSIKSLSKLQKLIFILTVKAELFYFGVQQFINDHTVKDNLSLDRSSIDSLSNLIINNNSFICIYYDSKCFNPMKIIQIISYNLNLALKSFSLGKSKINLDKLVSSFEDSMNQMVVFENVNLLDEALLPDFMKFLSKAYRQSQSKIKQERSYYILLYEISSKDNISKTRKFFKEIDFFYSIFLSNLPIDNIKSLMLHDYKYFFRNLKQTKDNPTNNTAKNSINSYLNHQFNTHKEKYNNNFQKIYSNSFLIFAIFLTKNINITRLKIKKENESDIDCSTNLTIFHNPYESMLMMIIFYEFINSYILRIITKLKEKEKGTKNSTSEKNEYSIISTFVNKKQIFEFMCTFYNNSFGVESQSDHSWSREVLSEILDFVINRLGQYSVKVYSDRKYLTPSISKESTDREIIEECLIHFPKFDHPVVIGSNRNQYVKYLYGLTRSLFNWMKVVDTDIFNSRQNNRTNKKIMKSVSISSSFLMGLGKNTINKKNQRMSLNFIKVEKNMLNLGSKSEKIPNLYCKSKRKLEFNEESVKNKEDIEGLNKIQDDFITANFKGMTIADDLNRIFLKIEKSYEEKIKIDIEMKSANSSENFKAIFNIIQIDNFSINKKRSSTNFNQVYKINNITHLLENILKKLPKGDFNFPQIEGILSTNLKIISRHTRKNSEANNQSKIYQDFFKKMNYDISISKRLSVAPQNILPLKSNEENSENNLELSGLKRSVSHVKSSLKMDKHALSSLTISSISKTNEKGNPIETLSQSNKHKDKIILKPDDEIKTKYKIETIKLNDTLSTFKSFALISQEIALVIDRLLLLINSNLLTMSVKDLSALDDILNNKVPIELLKLTNFAYKDITFADYLKWLRLSYKELKTAEETRFIAVDMKKDFKISKINTAEMIMNLGISYSIYNKLSLSEIILHGYFISSMEVVKEEGGVFLTNLKLFNCHYDSATNMLEEQKDKEFRQAIPLLYLITEKSNKHNTSLDILIMNEKNYKHNRQYLGLIEEDKVRKKFFTKFKINKSKMKQKNLTNMIQMTSFLLKNVNLPKDNKNYKEENLKVEEIIKENELEDEEKEELDDKINQSITSIAESEEDYQYDTLKDKIIKEKEIETPITTEYKNISLVDNFSSIESGNGLPNRVLPFRNSMKKNGQTKNYEVYNVRIPIINSKQPKNGHDYEIFLSFSSNLNQIFWSSMGAYAAVDPFE